MGWRASSAVTSSWAFGRYLRCATVPTDASPIRQNLLQHNMLQRSNIVAIATRTMLLQHHVRCRHRAGLSARTALVLAGAAADLCIALSGTRVRSAAFAPLQAAELGDVASQFFAGYLYGLHALPNAAPNLT